MDEIRLHGENEELKDEIIRLSKTYGVMSPYTSYLVQEDEAFAGGRDHAVTGAIPQNLPAVYREKTVGGVTKTAAAPSPPESGVFAVDMSKASREMREADAVSGAVPDIQYAGGRTLYLVNGIWTDSEFKDQKTLDIQTGSPAYVDFVMRYPETAKFAALGKVIFKYRDRFIRISDRGKETFQEKELDGLF